jgi:hypothetical protein
VASDTSLAQYFGDYISCNGPIKGGFWKPIKTAFGRNDSLRHLAYENGRGIAFKDSRGYEKIKSALGRQPEMPEKRRKTFAFFNEIKSLIDETDTSLIDKTDTEKYKSMKLCLQKIKKILNSCE